VIEHLPSKQKALIQTPVLPPHTHHTTTHKKKENRHITKTTQVQICAIIFETGKITTRIKS
jgi:hypothetical protein